MKIVAFSDEEVLADVAQRLEVSRGDLIRAAFGELGRLMTIDDRLDFREVRVLAADFGIQAVRRPPSATE